jgi:hypothetical protein
MKTFCVGIGLGFLMSMTWTSFTYHTGIEVNSSIDGLIGAGCGVAGMLLAFRLE